MSLEVKILSEESATKLFSIKDIENIAKIEYLNDNELDSNIAGKIQNAVSGLEAYLNRAITRKQYMIEKSFNRDELLEIDLPFPSHKSIDVVEKWNGTTWESVDSTSYTVTGMNKLSICFSKTWSTKVNERRYRVTYTAGWKKEETGEDALNISATDSLKLTQAIAEMVAVAYDGIMTIPVVSNSQMTALSRLKIPMSFA